MKTAILTTTIAASLFVGSIASAQTYDNNRGAGRRYDAPSVQHHASTATEGFLRGGADFARGMGEYNYYSSLARINNEEALTRYIDNRKKYTETYFEMRRTNREARAYERGPRPTPEQIEGYTKARRPKRLGAQSYDQESGLVNWPATLDAPQFAEQRAMVDQLITDRSAQNRDDDGTIKKLASQLQTKLKDQIRQMDPSEYMEARAFLTGLQHEMNFAPQLAGLVVR